MTSPGIKRPLDFEFTAHQSSQNGEEGATSTAAAPTRTEPENNNFSHDRVSKDPTESMNDVNVNTKRRCTDTFTHNMPSYMDSVIDTEQRPMGETSTSTNQQQLCTQQQRMTSPSPTPNDPSGAISALDEDIRALIKDELIRTQRRNHDPNDPISNTEEPAILTERQTYSICERLVRDRERKLRDQYDRKLARKLAEQYDLFAKANYLNTFAESARAPSGLPLQSTPTPVPSTTAAVAAMAAAAEHPSIKNAIAAAFMQRSAASPIVSPVSTPSPLLSAATSMPNLNSMAASLAANGHSVALPSNHLHHSGAYNLQQHQAVAAAAVLRQAQQEQQYLQGQQRRISVPQNGPILIGPVLLASSLDEQLATPEALFTLFGVFGDVIRVKILFNKKDNALIQMADANQAQVAQAYLDKQRIFGKVVRVSPSKHQVVQMPRDGNQSDAGLTKDFTNSPLHRFKIPGSRNYSNIYPPSCTLHISNIPATVDEGDLHKAFKEQCDFEFSSFKFFPKDRKMALMRFVSIEQATIALIKMHNFQISEENNLRVSFSKSAL